MADQAKTTETKTQASAGKPADQTPETKSPHLASVPGGAKKQKKYVEVTNDLPPVWEPQEEGESIEGFYVGPRTIKYRNTTFATHVIQLDSGDLVSFSGAIADRKMSRIPKGAGVMVQYLGMIRTNNGDAKNFKVLAEEGTRLLEEQWTTA